jgi:hypothetical protein
VSREDNGSLSGANGGELLVVEELGGVAVACCERGVGVKIPREKAGECSGRQLGYCCVVSRECEAAGRHLGLGLGHDIGFHCQFVYHHGVQNVVNTVFDSRS